jgi:hypothetical protein
MIRRWEYHDQPKIEKTPGKSNRQRSGSKNGETDREVSSRSNGNIPLPTQSWEASDQCRNSGAPLSSEWRSLRLWGPNCRSETVSRKPESRDGTEFHLPAAPLRCNIRLAYHAADASHPKGSEQARRRARNFAEQLIPLKSAGGEDSHRNGIT